VAGPELLPAFGTEKTKGRPTHVGVRNRPPRFPLHSRLILHARLLNFGDTIFNAHTIICIGPPGLDVLAFPRNAVLIGRAYAITTTEERFSQCLQLAFRLSARSKCPTIRDLR
jgi:hypothetical protein